MRGMCAFWVVVLIGVLRVSALTWNGGGDNDSWSSANNWGGVAPVGGEALVFAGSLRCTNVNDLVSGTGFSGLTFSSDAGLFNLSGLPITLDGNISNNSLRPHLINLDMVLSATRTVNVATHNLTLVGILSGSGGITKTGTNTLFLSGDNTYDGVTTVSSGALRISHPNALGSSVGGTVVNADYRLELSGNITVTNEAITIFGKGNNNGALQTVSGSNTWAGPIIIGATDSRIGVTPSNGVLVITGVISDGTNTYSLAIRNADAGGAYDYREYECL